MPNHSVYPFGTSTTFPGHVYRNDHQRVGRCNSERTSECSSCKYAQERKREDGHPSRFLRYLYQLSRPPSLTSVLGVGALTAPLISTQFAQMPQWNYFYLISLGVALSNSAALIFGFRGKPYDGAPLAACSN